MDSLLRDQIRAVDRCAIEELCIPGLILMENAGRNAADEIEEFLGGVAGKAVAIVAGTGNNGGDGFVIARHLAIGGAKVVTFVIGPPQKITGDAEVNLKAIYNLGHDIRDVHCDSLGELAEELAHFDAIVDAIGGTGIDGPLRGDAAAAVDAINAAAGAGTSEPDRPVIAIDIPTGLDCDTGQAHEPTVRADLTVTMLARKRGFDAPGAKAYTGDVRVVNIGIPPERVAQIAGQT